MTGKTLKELNVQVGDVVHHFTKDSTAIIAEKKPGGYVSHNGGWLSENAKGWSLVYRATPEPSIDLSTLSRDQLEELGQRVTVELEKKPEVAVMHGRRCGDAYWSFIPAPRANNTHKLTIPNNLPYGTYISSDGNESKVEEV